MELKDPDPAEQPLQAEAEPALREDLRQRFLHSREQEVAARTALRGVTRELALMRRLAKFFFVGPPPAAQTAPGIPRRAAMLVAREMICNLDLCEHRGDHTYIAGWAFHPAESWNARDTAVTILLQDGDTTYYAVAGKILRPDVAAHYAAHPPRVSGGAHGLDGVGFGCEISHDSLPAGREWRITLRLECGAMVCEASTGHRHKL